jgi:hypothetical protein
MKTTIKIIILVLCIGIGLINIIYNTNLSSSIPVGLVTGFIIGKIIADL